MGQTCQPNANTLLITSVVLLICNGRMSQMQRGLRELTIMAHAPPDRPGRMTNTGLLRTEAAEDSFANI